MTVDSQWLAMPAVSEAASRSDYPRLLRLARTAAGLTLQEAGDLAGYSISSLSRLETGRRKRCDLEELRRLANIYGLPVQLLGLSAGPRTSVPTTLTDSPDNEGGQMRRRALLSGAALFLSSAVLTPRDRVAASETMTSALEGILSAPGTASALSAQQLSAQIGAARADFRACRYTQLSRRLPRLLAQATAGHQQAGLDQQAAAAGRLAQAYSIATQLLIKLHDDSLASTVSDRAVQAARLSGDPLIEAEATRMAATALRRTRHRTGAQQMILVAAQQLETATHLSIPGAGTAYAQMLAVASYTAAVSDDRDSAQTFLAEAEAAVPRAGARAGGEFGALDLAAYKISVARILGDYGSAVQYAQAINPTQITSPERRARYWEDTALALQGRGRSAAAYQALLAAEKDTPEEVRYRPWAQDLTRDLVAGDTRNALPNARDFARRIGASA